MTMDIEMLKITATPNMKLHSLSSILPYGSSHGEKIQMNGWESWNETQNGGLVYFCMNNIIWPDEEIDENLVLRWNKKKHIQFGCASSKYYFVFMVRLLNKQTFDNFKLSVLDTALNEDYATYLQKERKKEKKKKRKEKKRKKKEKERKK